MFTLLNLNITSNSYNSTFGKKSVCCADTNKSPEKSYIVSQQLKKFSCRSTIIVHFTKNLGIVYILLYIHVDIQKLIYRLTLTYRNTVETKD